nr:hypothetical protein [Tanacetum cinerariifolium]
MYTQSSTLVVHETEIHHDVIINSRSKKPGNDIDVYLRPLIDDMIDLWETGVEIYDAYKKERKTIHMGHRGALHRHHPYRKKENLFNGTLEDRSMPKLMDGYATLSQVADLNITFRKKLKLLLNLVGLLLNIPGKTKDGVNAQKDMLAMGIRNLKLLGMKSHDCHVLLTQMIPIAIRGLMPPQMRQTITKLCLFFNMIHSKVLDHEKLEELQRDIILILCQLEMYFPPSFFDVMVYLVSHIVKEIKIAGPVFLRYMYPFKRYIGFLKEYVRNRYRPEGSIIQGLEGVGTIRRKDVTPNTKDLEQAHFKVLQNITCIEPYIQEHMSYLARKNVRREQRWLEAEHKKCFHNGWQIKSLKQDDKSTIQNSGVTLIATTTDSSRMEIAKDSYYDVIEEIWELDYATIVILILKCKWVDNTRSGYVRNRYRPEGSIIQGYAAEEVVQFCTNYMDDVTDIGLPQPRYQGRLERVGTIGRKDVTPNTKDLKQVHFTVLQNMTCSEPYIQEHMSYLVRKNGHREQRWLEAEHKKTFSQWLADKVIGMSPSNVEADVIQIGYRPRRVLQYQGYNINGYTFYTKKQDDKSTVQNGGVTLIATTTDSSRMEIAKDSYYGVIEEI